MMKRILPSLLLSLLLFSCSRSSFTLSSSRLMEGKEGLTVSVNTEGEGEDEEFSFILVSPDSDLKWEGKLRGKEGSFYSDELLITPGASFPKGEYELIVSSSKGTDVSEKVVY